jgi:aspartyl protease family protein
VDFARRSGTLLLVIAWTAVIGAGWWWFAGWERDQANPNRALAATGTEVVLVRNRAGHYVADGEINGERVTFLVDTGATTVALPLSLARRLGLALGAAVTVQTANGPKVAYQTRLASVRLGGIEQRDVAAIASDGMEGAGVLLGMSFLRHLDFSQRDGRLVLAPARERRQ